MNFRAGTPRFSWGLTEILSVMLIASTTLFVLLVIYPAQHRLNSLNAQLLMLSDDAKVATHPSGLVQPGEQLGKFYDFFQRDLTYTDWLARIYDMADRTGVELRQGDYQQKESSGIPLRIQELNLPVTGDYRNIRAFSQGVLYAVPVASLDGITFNRKSDQAIVDANLRFTLFLPAR